MTHDLTKNTSNSIPRRHAWGGDRLSLQGPDAVRGHDGGGELRGRTRSIIGAQALINAGVPNKVVSLNGTQDWHLAGHDVVKGATRRPPEISDAGMDAAIACARRITELCDIRIIDRATLRRGGMKSKSELYTLDVRTREEYETDMSPA